jgi:hypothetical protein
MAGWQSSWDSDFFLITEMIFAVKKVCGDPTGFCVME